MNAVDFERRDHRRKLRGRGGRGRHEERGAEYGRRRKSGGRGRSVERRTPTQLIEVPGSRSKSTLTLRDVFLSDETKAHRRHGLHGLDPDRGRHLAAHPLHRRPAAPRARVYYIEDSARLPYNPKTFEINDELRLRRTDPASAREGIRLRRSLGFLRALSAGPSGRRSIAEENPTSSIASRRHPQRLRHAGIQRRFACERSHSLHRKRSRAWNKSKSISAIATTIEISAAAITPCSLSAKTSAPKDSPCRRTD